MRKNILFYIILFVLPFAAPPLINSAHRHWASYGGPASSPNSLVIQKTYDVARNSHVVTKSAPTK